MDFHSILGKLRAIETLGLAEAAECNMTAEGEMCPVHGMEECAGYQSSMQLEDGPDRDGEYFSNQDSMAGSTIGQGGTSGTVPRIASIPEGEDLEGDGEDEGEPDELVDEEAALGGVPFTPLGATQKGPDQQGFVVTGGTNNTYFEDAQLSESLSINSSMNVQDGKVTKTLNVSATDEDVQSLAAVLRLAGIGGGHDHHGGDHHDDHDHGDHKACGCDGPCDCDQATMENADHDYGHDKKSETGEPLDVQDYIWDGPHINQRFGKIGDNTLMSERRDSLFKSLTEQYEQFLSEAELAPSDVGSQSPLTATKRDTFDKDPFAGDDAVTDGSHSPLSTVKRQDVMN